MQQTTTMWLYPGNTNPTAASKAPGWTGGEQQQPYAVLKSTFLEFPSKCRHAQRRQFSGPGVTSWEFRFRCARDGGQGMDTAPSLSCTFIWKSSSILSVAPSVPSLHPLLHKVVFAFVLPVITACISAVSGAKVQEASCSSLLGSLMETAASLLLPDNHYISMREDVSANAAGINEPACFLFQSKDKGGVCSERQ